MNNTTSKIRILKSSSYACGLLNEVTQTDAQLISVIEAFNSRSFFTTDYNDFLEAVGSVAIFTAIFIDAKLLADISIEKVLEDLKDLNCEIFFINASPKDYAKANVHLINDFAASEKFIRSNLDKFKPTRIGELCVFSSNSIAQYFFPKNDKILFSEKSSEVNFTADYTLSCQVQATNIFGYCFMRINIAGLESILGDDEITKSEFLLMDFSKELLNQFWGVVCQNIAKKGVYPNIGLPIACDSKGNAGMSKRYVPKIYLQDSLKAFSFELGFTAQDQSMPFDLTGVDFALSSTSEDANVELF